MLPTSTLREIFSYIENKVTLRFVCSYWSFVIAEKSEVKRKDYHQGVSKIEREKLLSQLKSRSNDIEPNPNTGTIPHRGSAEENTRSDSSKDSSNEGCEKRISTEQNITDLSKSTAVRNKQSIYEKLLGYLAHDQFDGHKSDFQKIRSDQKLISLVEYLSSGITKIERMGFERRRIKKLIRAWNASFLKQFGHVPTSSDRKGHLRELHEEYHKAQIVSFSLCYIDSLFSFLRFASLLKSRKRS